MGLLEKAKSCISFAIAGAAGGYALTQDFKGAAIGAIASFTPVFIYRCGNAEFRTAINYQSDGRDLDL